MQPSVVFASMRSVIVDFLARPSAPFRSAHVRICTTTWASRVRCFSARRVAGR